MGTFIRRPAASAGLLFFICAVLLSFAPRYADAVGWVFLGLFAASAVLWAVFGRRMRSSRDVRLFVCSLLAAVSLAGFVVPAEMPDVPEGEVTVIAEAQEKLGSYPSGGIWLVRIREAGGEKSGLCAVCELYDPSVVPGDVISATAVFGGLSEEGTDTERYYRSRGAQVSAVLDGTVYEGHEPSFLSRVALLREKLGARIDGAAGENAPVLRALTTGDRSGIGGRTKTSFAELGISHLLAISGLHMTVIAGTLFLLLTPLGKKRYAVMIPVIAVYTAVTGFAPSAVRAGVMLIIGCAASLAGRRRDTLSVLALAVAGIVVCDRAVIYDAGFLLSVSSVCALVWLGALLRRRGEARERPDSRSAGEISAEAGRAREKRQSPGLLHRLGTAVCATVLTSVAAVLFTLPVTVREFGFFSAVAPIANLLFIPLFTLILYMMPVFVISLAFPSAAAAVGTVVGRAAGAVVDLCVRLAGIAGITVSAEYPFFFPLSVMLVVLCIAAATAKKRRTAALGAVICAAAMAVSAISFEAMRAGEASVSVGNCSAGDIVYVTDGAHLCAVDAANGYSSAAATVEERMRGLRLTDVDAYVFTHYHSRAPVYVRKLAGRVRVRVIYLPEPLGRDEEAIFRRIEEESAEAGISVRTYAPDGGFYGEIGFGDVTVGVSERCFIPRSTEAIFAVDVRRGDDRAVYLSSGFFDAGGSFRDECGIGGADVYFFGTHGPRAKAPFVLPDDFSPEAVVLPEGTDVLFLALRGAELAEGGCIFVRGGYEAKWRR